MKGSKTRKKIFLTCIVFMALFMIMFIAALQAVTNSAYFEAVAEAEIKEMRQMYDVYTELNNYYTSIASAFASIEYINEDIAYTLEEIERSPDSAREYAENLAQKYSDYITNLDIYIIGTSSIIYIYSEDGEERGEIIKNLIPDNEGFMTETEAGDFLSANGIYKQENEYFSSQIIIENLKYNDEITLIAIPRYDSCFDFANNKIVIYNKYGSEELRLNTAPLDNKFGLSSLGTDRTYKSYGVGKNRYILCYFSNEDEKGDYSIGVIQGFDLSYRYLIYIFLILFFAVVGFGMWLWSEKITKPLDFFLMWIKLIKDKEVLGKGDETEMPMPKENYMLQNNIMLFFSFCLIPIVFAGALQWYTENQIINGYVEDRYAQSAEFYCSILDEQFELWRSPANLLCSDQRVGEALNGYTQEEKTNYDKSFIQYFQEYSNLVSDGSADFTIYDAEGKVVFSYFDDIEDDRYIKYRINVNEDYKWSFADGLDTFILHQKIYGDSGDILGYCRLELVSPNLHQGTAYTSDIIYSCYIYKYTDKVFNLLGSPTLTDEKVITMIRNPRDYPLTKSMNLQKASMNYFYIVKDKIFFDRIWGKYAITFVNVAFFIGIALIFAASFLTRATLNPIIHISNALYTDSPRVRCC